ncbi:Rrf2 family transcriptional regulator [Candidatus Kirkpatrickella diaphorinae]|uniref:Rrf2 family transcriptional regulator n=1 Tax=Candidatus Kirkpatrickella diaphorinae TaxID=2984322 RepID=A0ABY6GIB8_9PROT|nr:Rrf2 family transcriptional regulator [Candidatus Kirkpatrickella diaphorinae]UYH51150.1 Rrf2 family transcriptional regulator [Candidatus Kirkpatrickella diaphorinae]
MYLRRDRAMTAVTVMLDIAFHTGRTDLVSGVELAARTGLARRGIEPVLQTLSRSGLLESVRGPKGGYRLGRARRDISLDDIAQAVLLDEPAPMDDTSNPLFREVIDPCWQTLDLRMKKEMAEISLEELIRRAEKRGLRRPVEEPITFSI